MKKLDSIPVSAIDIVIFALKDFPDQNQNESIEKEDYIQRLESIKKGMPQIFFQEELMDIKKYLITIYSRILGDNVPTYGEWTERQWFNVNKQFESWIGHPDFSEFEISVKTKLPKLRCTFKP